MRRCIGLSRRPKPNSRLRPMRKLLENFYLFITREESSLSALLRKCRICGLEAHNDEELELFVKDKKLPYGRKTICKKCQNKYHYDRSGSKHREVVPYLRKCRKCGLEAWTEKDLDKFTKSKLGLYGYMNLCKKCENINVKNRVNKYPLKKRYADMIRRCYYPKTTNYHNYGGRGIAVCDEWHNDRQAFIDWAKSNGFKPELKLDRIDNDGSYSPDNCRWTTQKQQCRNKRTNTTNWEKKTRICRHCKIEKPLNEFYKSSCEGTSGYDFLCKECRSKHNKAQYQAKKAKKSL